MLRHGTLVCMSVVSVLLFNAQVYAGKLESHEQFAEKPASLSTTHRSFAFHPSQSNYPMLQAEEKFHYRPVAFFVETGSLRTNIMRIAKNFGWYNVVWGVPNDYDWLGRTRIHGINLSMAFSSMLRDYPLQAVFYHGNHVLAILPRTLK